MNDQQWARAIMERDNWTCQNCGTNAHLDAAHIISKQRRPDLRHELKNGVTLCRSCHEFYHAFPIRFGLFVEALKW